MSNPGPEIDPAALVVASIDKQRSALTRELHGDRNTDFAVAEECEMRAGLEEEKEEERDIGIPVTGFQVSSSLCPDLGRNKAHKSSSGNNGGAEDSIFSTLGRRSMRGAARSSFFFFCLSIYSFITCDQARSWR